MTLHCPGHALKLPEGKKRAKSRLDGKHLAQQDVPDISPLGSWFRMWLPGRETCGEGQDLLWYRSCHQVILLLVGVHFPVVWGCFKVRSQISTAFEFSLTHAIDHVCSCAGRVSHWKEGGCCGGWSSFKKKVEPSSVHNALNWWVLLKLKPDIYFSKKQKKKILCVILFIE